MSVKAHGNQRQVSVERYVPRGSASLVEDAPGWAPSVTPAAIHDSDQKQNALGDDDGPVCWKCRGSGQGAKKRARISKKKEQRPGESTAPSATSKSQSTAPSLSSPLAIPCGVCHGKGRLAAKKADVDASNRPGVIRKARTPPPGWQASEPLAFALRDDIDDEDKWRSLVRRADDGEDIFLLSSSSSSSDQDDAQDSLTDEKTNRRRRRPPPPWLPQNGEELVKLNGGWRILQRVGGHRWTTDDCVTAYVAVRESIMQQDDSNRRQQQQSMAYLDLGTGNASVLQMVLRALLQHKLATRGGTTTISAKGIEARREAVELARRSLLFNVGPDFPVEIVHGDFRDVIVSDGGNDDKETGTQQPKQQQLFDLVTGTPPYFRVDFNVIDVQEGEQRVQSAVIREGGMPTARQSAPARCEFRGGISQYCQAASKCLVCDTGRFVVCENYQNHERVLRAAVEAKLDLLRVVKVEGRQGRKPLFCVYVMRKLGKGAVVGSSTTVETNEATLVQEEVLAVRDDNGNWTNEYAESVFETMNIPQFAPSTKR